MRHEFYRGTENRPPLSNFIVFVDDKMQHDYQYHLVEPAGENFAPDFKPELTPVEMLNMGVFEGKYLNDCRNEFPAFWFENAHLSPKLFSRQVKAAAERMAAPGLDTGT